MYSHKFGLIAFAALLGCAANAATDAQPTVIKVLTSDVTVAADGSSSQIIHAELTANNDAAAMQLAQIRVPFNSAMQTFELVEAYTLKPGGAKIPADAGAVYEQSPQGAPVPLFTDQRVKVIVLPQFAAGDTAVYTVKFVAAHPYFAGQFFFGDVFPRSIAYGNVRETVTAPKSLPLNVENHDVEFSKRESGSDEIYSWHYSAPMPKPAEVIPVSPLDRTPRFFISSFKDYADLGRAYAREAEPMLAATPKITELAEQITKGTSDRRQQAEKIYAWVSKNVRYVAIELGKGSFIPHAPDTVVAYGYGDCKDHDTLLRALLKVKGIAADSVLLNSGNSYTLTTVPTFVQLDHVITWLPEFNLYLDSSAVVAPFGVLPFQEYGKPVVFARLTDSSLGQLPILAPGATEITTRTVAKADSNGTLTGTTTTTATGPGAILLRVVGLGIQALGPKNAAAAQLASRGYGGATGEFSPGASPVELGPSYSVTGTFSAPNYLSGDSTFILPGGMRVLDISGDRLMGPLYPGTLSDTEPTPCYSGHASEDLSLQAPPGRHFSSLPPDAHIKTLNLSFDAHWALKDDTLSVHRDFTSHIEQSLCAGTIRKETAEALKKIANQYDTSLSLSDASRGSENHQTADTANTLDTSGFDELNKHNFARAIEDFDKAIAENPSDAFALRKRGVARGEIGQFDKAFQDFDAAVKLDPQDTEALGNRGVAYNKLRQYDRAIQDFDRVIAIDPAQTLAYRNRGEAFADTKQFPQALADFDRAIKIEPGDTRNWLGRAVVHNLMGEYAKAISDCNKAIDMAPKNAFAYLVRGRALHGLGDHFNGNRDIAKASQLDPKLAK